MTPKLVQTNFRLANGVPVLYGLIHDDSVDSDQLEDQHHVLQINGDHVERHDLHQMRIDDEGYTLDLQANPSIQMRLTTGDPFMKRPVFRCIRMGMPAVPMFRCDPDVVSLGLFGQSLDYDNVRLGRLATANLLMAVTGAMNLFREGSTFILDNATPQSVIQILNLVGKNSSSLWTIASRRSFHEETRPVPKYLLHNLRDTLKYYEGCKRMRHPLNIARLKRVGPMLIASAQPVLLAAGHRLGEILTEPQFEMA